MDRTYSPTAFQTVAWIGPRTPAVTTPVTSWVTTDEPTSASRRILPRRPTLPPTPGSGSRPTTTAAWEAAHECAHTPTSPSIASPLLPPPAHNALPLGLHPDRDDGRPLPHNRPACPGGADDLRRPPHQRHQRRRQ